MVAFDDQAAVVLGRRFPESVLQLERKQSGMPKHYIKYDALIVAAAIRHRATHLVTLDGPLTNLSARAGLEVVLPNHFERPQMRLPNT